MREKSQWDDRGQSLEPANSIVPVDAELANHEIVSWEDTSSGAPAASPDAGLRGIQSVLRYKWSIAIVFLLTAGVSVPLIYKSVKPSYRSTAVVRVSPVGAKVVWETENSELTPVYYRHVNTQVSIIQSQGVLRPVLQREDVRASAWYRRNADPSGDVTAAQLDALLGSLEVRLRKDSELIDVSVVDGDPKSCAILANAIVIEFERYNQQQLRDEDINLLNMLHDEEEKYRREIRAKADDRYQVSKALGTDTPDELRSNLSLYLNSLEVRYEELEHQHRLTLGEMKRMGDEAPAGTAPGGAGAAFAADPQWYQLSVALQQARMELEAAKERYGEAHPELRERTRKVNSFKQMLADREQQLSSGAVPAGANGTGALDASAMRRLVQAQVDELELLRTRIQEQRRRVADASTLARDIEQFDRDLARMQKDFDDVRARRTQLETEGKAPARITVADLGIEPIRPHQSKRKKLCIIAMGGAFMFSLSIAYLRSRLDRSIREVADVRSTTRAPFLGQLPVIPDNDTSRLGSNPAFMECVRIIRTALLERIGGRSRQVILITSSTEQTGKTTLSSLLARSFAVLGKRTLLVEADLRKPSLSKHFNISSDVGLAAVLSGAASDEDAIIKMSLRNLDIIVAGVVPPDFNPELLADGVFSACLARWRSQYDLILLDSPPVLPVADSRILATQADGVVMVLRASHTKRPDVIRAYADLSASGGTLLGSVLVGVPAGRGYGYGGYGSYGGYAAALTGDQTAWTPKE